jgi:signal transduction histidine kinase/CHASE3 domain sensor protein/ActR/RegA family two-component response regulator
MPSTTPTSRIHQLAALAFIGCVVALFGTLWSAAGHLATIDEAQQLEHEAEEALLGVGRVQEQLQTARAGLRGYLLTGDVTFLEPYHAARDDLAEEVHSLDAAAAELVPLQVSQAYLERVDMQLQVLATLLDTFEERGGRAVLRDLETGDGHETIMAGRQARNHLHDALSARIALARDEADLARRGATRQVVGGGLVAAIVCLLVIAVATVDTRRIEAARRDAQQLAGLLAQQEGIAQRLHESTDIDHLLRSIVEEGRRLTRTEVFAATLVHPRRSAVDTSPRAQALSRWDPFEQPPGGLDRLGSGTVVLREDPMASPTLIEGPDDLQSVVVVPIPGPEGKTPLGHLIAAEPWEPMTDAHRAVLASLARAVGTAVANLRLMEGLRDEAERREDFIGVLGHELRNPLHGIAGAAQLLERDLEATTKHGRLVRMVARQSRHMRRLLDDLLDVERIRLGKLQLDRKSHDLSVIIRETAEEARVASGMALRLQVPEHAPAVVDRARLVQCLHNLIDNARRHSPAGAPIEIHLERDDDRYRLAVLDRGPGLDDTLLPVLFERHAQGSQAGTLGLGLAVVRGLVEQHGGSVQAGERDGGGARIELVLPAPRDHRSPLRDDPSLPPATVRHQLRVVVVDDREDARTVLRHLLEMEGHEVHTAVDGTEGLQVIRDSRPDIVLCDLGLGGELDGFDVAEAVRADPELRHIPLVAVSGYTTERARRRSSEAGFDRHLAKPLDFDDVTRALDELVSVALAG